VKKESPQAKKTMSLFPSTGTSVIMAADDVNLDSATVRDVVAAIAAMTGQEGVYCSSHYLGHDLFSGSAIEIGDCVNQESREKLCCWCFQLVEFLGFSRETVWVAFSCLDRFLSTPRGEAYLASKEKFQLATVTCLYIAIKIHETFELDVELIVQMGKGLYTARDILKTESDILLGLDWRLNPATPHDFFRRILSLMPASVTEKDKSALMVLAKAQLDLATLNYNLSIEARPSIVAAAILMNSVDVATTISDSSRYHSKATIKVLVDTLEKQRAIIACRRILLVIIGGGRVADPVVEDSTEEQEDAMAGRRFSKRGKTSNASDFRALCA
jgi:hypothetical protein